MAIKREDVFVFNYFNYGEAFHGSYKGMRYRIAREPLVKSRNAEGEGQLRVYSWPEPFAFDKTPEEQLVFKDFEFSEEGVCQAIEYLNGLWEESYAES